MKRISAIIVTGALFAVFAGQSFAAGQSGGKGMGGMKDGMMQQMMQSPHHKLVMAHKKNLLNFATALKAEVKKSGKVDKQFAETAVEEMKRSLGQMKKYHDEHKNMMSEETRQQMGDHVKMMESRFATVQQHVDQLDKDVKAESPDPKKVMAKIDQIMKQCDMMKIEGMKKRK